MQVGICEWIISEVDEKEIVSYASNWEIPEICAAILYSRGAKTKDDVSRFLKFSAPIDPFELTDMDKAANCLKLAIKNGDKICIYGDYDADGITSTALIYLYLTSIGAKATCYIPSREEEGYGLNAEAIKKIHKEGTKLLLTVDNGVSAYDEVKLAVSLGMKVVITDHHKMPEKLPAAEAIVDPCRENWDLKYRNLAGVGVAYKLIEAIEGNNFISSQYIDLVALGTVGDSMPLFGESRELLKKGLKSIKNSKIKGIRFMLEHSGLKNKEISSIDLAFKLVPRINASGRMKSAQLALKLLTSDDDAECMEICTILEELNTSRKSVEQMILEEAEKYLRENPFKKYENIIIIKGKNWHHGVLGIAASRIVQKYGKPCILISFSEDGEARGSCRSVEGFSIYEAITLCSEYLERFGGHTLAAGINLKAENVDKFSEAILERTKNQIPSLPKINIDLELNIKALSKSTLEFLEILQPFGNGNPEPIFLIKKARLKKIIGIGKGSHLKLNFFIGYKPIDLIYFGKTHQDFLYKEGDILDIAVTLHPNIYKFGSCVSMHVVDIKLSGIDIQEVAKHKKMYEQFKLNLDLTSEELKILLPSREDFAGVYRYLVSNEKYKLRVDVISFKVFKDSNHSGKIYVILEVLCEMNLIELFWDGDEFNIRVNRAKSKVDLNSSEVLKTLKNLKCREGS